jgi:hypothetical protein
MYKPIEAIQGQPPPIVLRAITRLKVEELAGGVPSSAARTHVYVLLEAMPSELRRRIELAVQAIAAGQ